jgi:integration host factor subunit beta
VAVLEEIAGALERGMRVELRGVGVLTVKQKDSRQGRNPRTGAALVIEPQRVVRFKASELLLARLNRPASRPPERRKSDSRQLVFPINGQRAEPADGRTRPTLPQLAHGRTTSRKGRKGIIYEKGE